MFPIDPQELIKLTVDILIDQIEKRGPELMKKVREEIRNRRKTQIYVPRVEMVNRESEQRAIQSALNGKRRLHLLYFVGEGGAGKTRLLQTAEQYIKSGGKTSSRMRWGGLHDFYHTELHSVTALQQAIVNGLDELDIHFQEFRNSLAQFNRLIANGLVGPAIEAERQKLNDLFFEEYKAFAKQYRPVFAFDTLESLTHESDWVESLCKVDDVPIASREWMIRQIGRLENTVVLMAGRPDPVFRKDLEMANRNHPGQLETIEINGLTREDSRQFLAMLLKEAPTLIKPLIEKVDQLWQITRGLPVHLALAVDLASRAQFLANDAATSESAESFGQSLVGELFSAEKPETRILFLMALARKGMTAEALHYLEPERSTSSWAHQLEGLRNLSIVKTRSEQDEFFLHDALYELFDAYFPALSDLEPWYERIADYYRGKHARARREITTDSQVSISLLYYELQRNPRHAFGSVYLPLRERALKGHELELDIHLRDELLRFIYNPALARRKFEGQTLTHAEVDRDGAIRWIKRYLIQSNYQKAIMIAETILALAPRRVNTLSQSALKNETNRLQEQQEHTRKILNVSDPLFWGQVLTYYCEALIYTGQPEHYVIQSLKQAHNFLDRVELGSQTSQKWLNERVRGRASNILGYLYRSNGHYGRALLSYQKALPEFRSMDVEDEEADTLNNLAFILSLLGAFRRSMDNVNRALELRERLGQKHPLALSHNTRGLIYALQGQFEQGRKESHLALNMFQELETPRGIGLAYNALGYILRKQGEGWKSELCSHSQAIQCFQQSGDYLRQAEEIFAKKITEPIRLWEAYNEQGSLHGEWGRLLDNQKETKAAQFQYTKAIESQSKALETAREHKMHFQEADTYDDLAKVARGQGNNQQAKQWLNQALSLVPKEYTSQKGKNRKAAPPAGEAYWLILGKIYLQEGTWAIQSLTKETLAKKKQQEYTQSVFENFARASYYFERYWPGTSANQQRFRFMADQIKQLALPIPEIRQAIKGEGIRLNINVSPFLMMFL